MKTLGEIAAIVIIGVMFALIFAYGWSKNEVVECHTWLEQSRQYVGWYSTNWQREQCKAHGITLPEGFNP